MGTWKGTYKRLSLRGTLLAALAAWLFTAMIVPISAQASNEHPYLSNLSLIGQFPTALCGVATDSNGDLYLAEGLDEHVLAYNSAVEFLTRFSSEFPCNMAIGSADDIYVNNKNDSVVKYILSNYPPAADTKYNTDEAVVKGQGIIDNSKSASVAINPVTQNVYVAEVTEVANSDPQQPPEHIGRIVEYEPDGKPIDEMFGAGVVPQGTRYSSIDVDGSSGDVYAIDEVHNKVYILNNVGTEIIHTINGDNVPGCSEEDKTKEECFGSLAETHLAVEQATGNVYIDDIFSRGVVDEFTTSGAYVTHIGPTFGPSGSLHLEDHERYQSDIAVDNSPTSPNYGSIFVISQPDTGQAGSLYAFGPLSLKTFYPLSVAKKGGGSGIVTSTPVGIECGSTCSHEYEENTKVTLTVTPSPGSELTGWTNCETEPTPDECEVTMSKAISVTVTSSLIQHTLTVTKTGTGSQPWRSTVTSSPAGIECGSHCSYPYNENTKIILTPSAAPGTAFAGWTGADCTGVGACQVTLSSDADVTATFVNNTIIPTPPTVWKFSEPIPPGVLSITNPTITTTAGKAPLPLTCTGYTTSTACAGELQLTTKIKRGKSTVNQTLGQAPCNIHPGDTRTLPITLNNAANKLLASGKVLTATLTGPNSLSHTITLKPATTKKHKRPANRHR